MYLMWAHRDSRHIWMLGYPCMHVNWQNGRQFAHHLNAPLDVKLCVFFGAACHFWGLCQSPQWHAQTKLCKAHNNFLTMSDGLWWEWMQCVSEQSEIVHPRSAQWAVGCNILCVVVSKIFKLLVELPVCILWSFCVMWWKHTSNNGQQHLLATNKPCLFCKVI